MLDGGATHIFDESIATPQPVCNAIPSTKIMAVGDHTGQIFMEY